MSASANSTTTARGASANTILETLAMRSRPHTTAPRADVPDGAGRYAVRADLLEATVERLPVDSASGRWRFRVQVRHDARPDTVLYEEIRLGEPDAGNGTVDGSLARHGWWTLDDLAEAAVCRTERAWVRPHEALGLYLKSVDEAARHVALWDASRAIALDLEVKRDYIDARARRNAGRDLYPIVGRPMTS